MGSKRWQTIEWIPTDSKRVLTWFQCRFPSPDVNAREHSDILAKNHIIVVADPKQPVPPFYGGGYPESAPASVVFRKPKRLVRQSADQGNRLPSITFVGLAAQLLSRQNRDSFLGDLEERYGLLLKDRGRRAANHWFYRGVFHSFLSLEFDALKRVSGLEKWYRRIGS